MPEMTVELAVGDVLQIGHRTLTVIEIEGSEVHFRLDEDPDSQSADAAFPLTDLFGSCGAGFRLKAK